MDIQAYIQSGVIESYVLGLASAEEAAEVELMSSRYAEVKQAIELFSKQLEAQAFENATTPPSFVKEKLFEQLKYEFSVDESTETDENPATVIPIETKGPADNVKPFKLWQYIAAAAIILFIVSAGLNIYFYNNYKQLNTKYQALVTERNSLQASNDAYRTRLNNMHQSMDMMSDPDMKMVMMKGVKGKENALAKVYWNMKTKDVYLMPESLPQTPQGKQYQLWAIVDGKPVDAGVLGDCEGLCKMKNIPHAQAFAITLEKKGGSETPTLSDMYVMGGS